MRIYLFSLATFILSPFMLAACSAATETAPVAESNIALELTPFVEDAEFPWGMVFLPNGDLLFTEQERGLRLAPKGKTTSRTVTGMPPALNEGQGGYLGLTLDPDFASNRLVYVAYSEGTADDNATAIVKARLNEASTAIESVERIFRGTSRDTAFHYGARLQFLNDGTLICSIGEGFRYMKEAQNTANTHGKVVRINTDGSIPEDNPFATGGGHPAVWSYGHRNIQGMIYLPETNQIYATEHGPKGGDELNLIEKGANYGWPKVSYGVNYDGTIITRDVEASGVKPPLHFWVPSIAPAGLVRLTGNVYPGWEGDFFSGGMNGPAGQKLVRLDMENGAVVGVEDLLEGDLSIRDVIEGPDGHLYVADKGIEGIFRVDIAN